jgi:hypothetical protein
MTHIHNDLQTRWWSLEAELAERFGKKPDMEAILFLIGIQEADKFNIKFTKEQKQDLMHVGVCRLLMPGGFYCQTHVDADGWPHFEQTKPFERLTLMEQEDLLREYILLYFDEFKHHQALPNP